MCRLKIVLSILFSLIICCAHAQHKLSGQDSLPLSDSIRNIELHEVKVVARENRSVATSSMIGREAIQHVQPFNLSNLMQLLPGGITPQMKFSTPALITLRHLGSDLSTNALGTGISIDGVRLSVNAEMQQHLQDKTFSIPNTQTGIDTRGIAADNIESVEVIRGIPSVRYGDITSGMVIIHTRKDARPYTASIRMTPEIKSISLGKGWQTGKHGAFNFSGGFLNSSPGNTSSEQFYRISVETGYSGTYNRNARPLSIETGATGSMTINRNPSGLLLQSDEYIKAKNQAFRFHFSGNWQPDYGALTSVDWKTSVNYTHSVNENNLMYSGIYSIGTDATTDVEQQGFFIPPQYWQRQRITSSPVTTSMEVSATLRKSRETWKSRTSLGLGWVCEGNVGKGKTNEIYSPALPTQNRYDFRDIPFMHHYALYAEEQLDVGRMTVEGGIRLTRVTVHGKNFQPVCEPRLNLNYLLLQNTQGLRRLRLRGGVGLLRKMPTLSYLFQQPTFHNLTNYRYRDEENGQSLAVVTTIVSQLTGSDKLKLPQNFKAEAGFSGLFRDFSFDITGFYERLTNGFSQELTVKPVVVRNYNMNNDKGLEPEYRDGEVYVDGIPAGYTNDTTFNISPAVGNSLYERKGGVEFTLRTDYVRALATTFILDGAWIIRQSENKSLTPIYVNQTTNNRSYSMCGIYDNGLSRKIFQNLTTTLRAVTEIPALRLTTTVVLQSVWMDRSREKITDNENNRFYMKDAEGNRIEGDFYQDADYSKYKDPVFYMDTRGEIHRFTPELSGNPVFEHMVVSEYPRKFLKSSFSPYFLLNLRVTKEIGEHVNLSFFANNLAKMNPRKYNAPSGQYRIMNPPAFFGVELQIRL